MKTLFKKSSKRLKPNEVIKKVMTNLNRTKPEKYQMESEEVEKKALSDDDFREKYFYRPEKVGKHANRLDRYNIKKDINSPKKLRDPLQIGFWFWPRDLRKKTPQAGFTKQLPKITHTLAKKYLLSKKGLK